MTQDKQVITTEILLEIFGAGEESSAQGVTPGPEHGIPASAARDRETTLAQSQWEREKADVLRSELIDLEIGLPRIDA